MAVVLRRRGVALIACTLLAQLLGHGQGQQPAAQPVWAGTTAEHLFAEYGTIFGANGNRNAASHLWSTFLIDRTWQMPEPQVLELFRSFCPVSGSPVRPADRNRYQVGVPAGADGGLRHGITHFCCAPCVCDTLEFINMDTKTIATADGPRVRDRSICCCCCCCCCCWPCLILALPCLALRCNPLLVAHQTAAASPPAVPVTAR